MTEVAVLEPRLGWLQSWLPWLRWTPTSPQELEVAEQNLLAFSTMKSTGFYVSAGEVNGEECRIWTRNSVVHSHWSRNVEARLSLVETFIGALMP